MFILFLLLMCGIANADVYVVTAPDKSVYAISPQDDIVVPSGYNKSVIKKNISDITVSVGEEYMYDFNGSKFTLNSKKVQEKTKADTDKIAKDAKEKSDRESAINKLKVLGLSEDEIGALVK